MAWLAHLTPWHWLGLGAVLLILEVFAAGTFFFLWPALAAGILGLLLFVAPDLAWQTQVLLFAVLSVASVVAWRRYAQRRPAASDHPTLNRRGEQYVGRCFTLSEPIVNGTGRIRVDDTLWRVAGAELPSGAKVKVVGVDGVVLRVEPAP